VALSTSTTKANPSKDGDAKLPVYRSLRRIHDSGVTESDASQPVAQPRSPVGIGHLSIVREASLGASHDFVETLSV
jgi:hypothetical protein